MHGSLAPPKSTSQTASQSVQPFLQGPRSLQTDGTVTVTRPDHTNPSAAVDRPHLARTAIQPENILQSHTQAFIQKLKTTYFIIQTVGKPPSDAQFFAAAQHQQAQ